MSSGDHRLSERETILSGASEPPKWCGFLSIARELRDIIYTELIASGNIAILQVSKQVHDEAKDLLYKQGICRLDCYYKESSDYVAVLDPPHSRLNDVRNFDLKIHTESYGNNLRFPGRVGRIDPDLQPCIQGSGSCHVTIICDRPRVFDMPNPVIELIESLSTFKLVIVRTHVAYVYHPLDRRNRDIVAPRHKNMLELMSTEVSASLGDSEWKSETCNELRYTMLPQPPINPFPNAPYLEFHPPKEGKLQEEPGSTVLHVRQPGPRLIRFATM